MLRKLLMISLILALGLAACIPAAPVTTAAPVETAAVAPAPTETSAPAPTANLTDGCLPEGAYDPSIDYFPEKISLTHTTGFSIAYHNHYKVLTIPTPYPGATESVAYALVQCGAPAPAGFTEEQIIEVPVKRLVTMSTSYLPFLDELGLLDRLVGLDDATFVSNAAVLEMAAAGELISLGYGSGVDVEKALELAPDLIMTYSAGFPDYDAHPVLLAAGLKVVLNAEWLDTSPLGRAEWGKFLAAFFNAEAAAEALFAQTVQRYTELAALAAGVDVKPTVFLNTDFQGTWSMPGGSSYAASFLKDAGADYLWADDPATGSLPLAFEAVYERTQAAEVWLNIGFFFTLDDLAAADARYADFEAFKTGSVWNNDGRVSAAGGNDFYESAVAHPETVLADLIKILHPDLLPDHELVYYRQME